MNNAGEEGISEGFRSAEPERVALGGGGAVEPRHRTTTES
jgi:hypothetical protein